MATKSIRELLETNMDAAEDPENAGEGSVDPSDAAEDISNDSEDTPEGSEDTSEGDTPPSEDTPPAHEAVPPSGSSTPPGIDIPTPPADTIPKSAPGATPPGTAPERQAPGTWRPEAREVWKTIPKPVQDEIWKREIEATKSLNQSTQAREFEGNFGKMMQPYIPFINAEGGNPLQAVNNVMRTATLLRIGSPEQKAQTVANVIKSFGVNLEMLDSLLAGEQMQSQSQETVIGRLLEEKLQPMQRLFESQSQLIRNQELETERGVNDEVEQFSKTHEFYWDVKDTMADLMEIAIKRNQTMDLTQAYDRAILIHEPVRRVLDARKQSDVGKKQSEAAARARARSGSVTPS